MQRTKTLLQQKNTKNLMMSSKHLGMQRGKQNLHKQQKQKRYTKSYIQS